MAVLRLSPFEACPVSLIDPSLPFVIDCFSEPGTLCFRHRKTMWMSRRLCHGRRLVSSL